MSTEYLFKIELAKRNGKELNAVHVIENMIKGGWSLFSEEGKIIYADISDEYDFHFMAKNISKAAYYDMVNEKQIKCELIAFAMFYIENEHAYRIDVIITSDFQVLISIDDLNKKMLCNQFKLLDINWYAYHIIPYLTNDEMQVEFFSFYKY